MLTASRGMQLALGTLGIYVVYCLASLLQEYIIKHQYEDRFTGQLRHFTNTNTFVLIPSAVSWLYGTIATRSDKTPNPIPPKSGLICAGLVVVSTLAMTQAIYITSFPIVMMFKSTNILSVVLVGVLCSRVNKQDLKLTDKQVITGAGVTIGLLMFYLGGYHRGQPQTAETLNLLGLFLLIVSTLCDGFLPDMQAELKATHQPTAMQLFTTINKYKTFLSLGFSAVTMQLPFVCEFLYRSPGCLVHLVLLSSLGALGQVIVYWLINLFRQHVVPFIITTRKLGTVVLSVVFFGHAVTVLQVLGVVVTLGAVAWEFWAEVGHLQADRKFITQDEFEEMFEEQFTDLYIDESEPKHQQPSTESSTESVQQVSQPAVEPAFQPQIEPQFNPPVDEQFQLAVQPPAEAVVEQIAQAKVQPVQLAQPILEPAIQSASQPAVESSIQPRAQPAFEQRIQAIVDTALEPAADNAVEPAVNSVEPVAEPAFGQQHL